MLSLLSVLIALIICCALERPLSAASALDNQDEKPKVSRVIELKDDNSAVTVSKGDTFEGSASP